MNSLCISAIILYRFSDLGTGCHHGLELLETDFSVAVLVNLCNVRFQLVFGNQILKVLALEHLQQLILGDVARVVFVKHLENSSKVVVSHKDSLIHGGSKELGVVDGA